MLLDKNKIQADVKDEEERRILLSYAAESGHDPLVKLLVEKDANIEAEDVFGQTPLTWAAMNGHEGILQKLLDKGKDIKAKGSSDKRAVLTRAARNGHEGIVRILLTAGANIEARSDDVDTPLLAAAFGGHTSIVWELLDKGANIEALGRGKGGQCQILLLRKGVRLL